MRKTVLSGTYTMTSEKIRHRVPGTRRRLRRTSVKPFGPMLHSPKKAEMPVMQAADIQRTE